ncbi:MAG TPA: endonuclease/exonuclease/phosphatase family protein [Candidatus Absconditabacterales bacterium]|nr:endonuclease/exonuclease/phosphatase family protein [Candidatus Absconditabacterales bacterium]
MIFVVVLLTLTMLLLFFYLFPAFYISELVISFLPYIIFFALGCFVLGIALLKNKKIGIYVKFVPLFILIFGLIFFLFSKKYNSFYTGEGFGCDTVNTGDDSGLDILYSNILYKNSDYTGLQIWIEKYDPDMLMIVEFTDDHNENLKNILQEKYPYSARTTWSQIYFGSVVFSKYPITNLTNQVDQGSWRYSYFHTRYNSKNYYIYLVHASSPVTYKYFEMRNKHFDTLGQDFAKHIKTRTKNDKVLMLGDFNVSPWSYYYDKLVFSLTGLEDITKRFTILFTWRIKFLPFLQSHIDHIFTSNNISFENVEKVKTPGSDHYGFFMQNIK